MQGSPFIPLFDALYVHDSCEIFHLNPAQRAWCDTPHPKNTSTCLFGQTRSPTDTCVYMVACRPEKARSEEHVCVCNYALLDMDGEGSSELSTSKTGTRSDHPAVMYTADGRGAELCFDFPFHSG